MRIVMASVYPPEPGQISGGVESVVVNLVRELQEFPDLDMHVVTLGAKGSVERTVVHNKVTVHYLPWVNLPGYLSNLACLSCNPTCFTSKYQVNTPKLLPHQDCPECSHYMVFAF